jgi:hypothetical protein
VPEGAAPCGCARAGAASRFAARNTVTASRSCRLPRTNGSSSLIRNCSSRACAMVGEIRVFGAVFLHAAQGLPGLRVEHLPAHSHDAVARAFAHGLTALAQDDPLPVARNHGDGECARDDAGDQAAGNFGLHAAAEDGMSTLRVGEALGDALVVTGLGETSEERRGSGGRSAGACGNQEGAHTEGAERCTDPGKVDLHWIRKLCHQGAGGQDLKRMAGRLQETPEGDRGAPAFPGESCSCTRYPRCALPMKFGTTQVSGVVRTGAIEN